MSGIGLEGLSHRPETVSEGLIIHTATCTKTEGRLRIQGQARVQRRPILNPKRQAKAGGKKRKKGRDLTRTCKRWKGKVEFTNNRIESMGRTQLILMIGLFSIEGYGGSQCSQVRNMVVRLISG